MTNLDRLSTGQDRQVYLLGAGLAGMCLIIVLLETGCGPTVTQTPARTAGTTKIPTATYTPAQTATPAATETPVLGIGSTQVREADGMVMMYVPGGSFLMGSHEGYPDEQPEHMVDLDAFWIDQTEITNGMYALCVAAEECDPPDYSGSKTRIGYYNDDQFDHYPVIYVSWLDAMNYCMWAGGRLPTEAEWEFTARGEGGALYPWGQYFNCHHGNFDDTSQIDASIGLNCDGYADTSLVGSFPAGASPYGVMDMAGNVWEWTADWYGSYPSMRESNPSGPQTGVYRVLRGGSWYSVAYGLRSAMRTRSNPTMSNYYSGFRCVQGIP